jgi:hypothetical protein
MSSSSTGIIVAKECQISSYHSGHFGHNVGSKYTSDNGNLFRVILLVAGLPSYGIRKTRTFSPKCGNTCYNTYI